MRYPSNWNSIVENWQYLQSQKQLVTVNTTISIYNIDTLDILFRWIDKEFPGTLINCTLVSGVKHLNPLLFPDRDLALQSLKRVMQTDCYKNHEILSTTVNSLYQQFENRKEINNLLLKDFFKFNNLLDHNRNTYLKDYIPNLEKYRDKYEP
jgi:hypothetical protein